MAVNDKNFIPPEATQTLLRVRGFSANGLRSGGIEVPQIFDLPAGSVLFMDERGRQRRARQIMLPKPWEYKASLPRVLGGLSSQHLPVAVSRYSRQRLAFE